MTTVRDVLNRLRWDAAAERRGVVIEVRVRDRGGERVTPVAFESVAEIRARGIEVADGTYLPYHRFVCVRRGANVLWPPAERA